MNSYTQIPNAVFQGMASGEFSRDEFEVLAACYYWADRKGWIIRSYSAARLCRFLGLDATEGNVRRFERAARNLLDRKIIRRDYHRGKERTYNVWVPVPERFQRVGSPDENQPGLWCADHEVSLYQANVGVRVGDNVGVQRDGTQRETSEYNESEPDSVGVSVGESGSSMSITNQESREIEPLNPLRGLLPPAPQGEHSNAVGLFEPFTMKARALTPEQCGMLAKIAVEFRLTWIQLYQFDPDEKHVSALLRKFSPWEIYVAYGDLGETVGHNLTAVFFRKTAADLIRKRRESNTEFTSICGWVTHFDAVQKSWCALFGKKLQLRFRKDGRGVHFYHPALAKTLAAWHADEQRATEGL
jgi:hypothetical protein